MHKNLDVQCNAECPAPGHTCSITQWPSWEAFSMANSATASWPWPRETLCSFPRSIVKPSFLPSHTHGGRIQWRIYLLLLFYSREEECMLIYRETPRLSVGRLQVTGWRTQERPDRFPRTTLQTPSSCSLCTAHPASPLQSSCTHVSNTIQV